MKKVIVLFILILGIGINISVVKADEPVKKSSTYGYQNHKGITLGKENVLSVVYDAVWHHWYIEMEHEDAIDYDRFYFSHNTPYLDFIKVYIDDNLIVEFIKDYKNMSYEDFEDKYDVLEVDMRKYNIFYTLNKN